jgi:hypothetical protein
MRNDHFNTTQDVADPLADFAARIAQGRLDNEEERIIYRLVLARSAGASVRALAGFVGISKSAMGRWLPAIDAIASQMGQRRANPPEISESACPKRDTADAEDAS